MTEFDPLFQGASDDEFDPDGLDYSDLDAEHFGIDDDEEGEVVIEPPCALYAVLYPDGQILHVIASVFAWNDSPLDGRLALIGKAGHWALHPSCVVIDLGANPVGPDSTAALVYSPAHLPPGYDLPEAALQGLDPGWPHEAIWSFRQALRYERN